MPTEIIVPAFGESVVEGTVGQWYKRQGENVTAGEPVVALETEKVNTEIAAAESGVLTHILRHEGETVRPGDVLGTIERSASESPKERPQQPSAVEAAALTATPSPSVTPEAQRLRVSPVAQRLAEQQQVDLSRVQGTGPAGRIMRGDVEARVQEVEASKHSAPPSSTVASPTSTVSHTRTQRALPARDGLEIRQRLSRRRLTIARRLVEAQHTAAMLTTFNEIDMHAVVELRRRRRESFRASTGVDLGYMSFFVKSVVGALKAYPQINSELREDELILKHYYDIGIAIGDPEGLVVPVLHDADRLTFAQIEDGIKQLIEKANSHTLSLDDLRGGTFTITNGGVFGSLFSTPILNPPQVGILGMHKISERPVAIDGQVVVRPTMFVALTYDHRVVDGRDAVLFLVLIKEMIEDPERLLLEA